MSVLIKGIDELPEDGTMFIVKHDNDKVYIKRICVYGYSHELIKLSEKHGRLIDADVLDYTLGAEDRDIYVKCILEEAPTVIEAEGE